MKRPILIAALLSSALASPVALAKEDDCKAPMAQWQPREAVEQMAKAQGWTVRRIKVDDGCYQIRGMDADGREIAVKVDPGSLAIVRMKQRNGRGDGDDARPRSTRARARARARTAHGGHRPDGVGASAYGRGCTRARAR